MTVNTPHRPIHRDALVHLEAALEHGGMMTILGRCTVDYDDRAISELGPGDRLIVLKPDDSILVRTDKRRTPINWQPPGCTYSANARDGRLRIRSTRTSPDERLDVQFERVEQYSAYTANGRSDLELAGSEEDLRQHIFSDPDVLEPGFESLEAERQNDVGAVDTFGEDAADVPVVVELKQRRVDPSTASQLHWYVDALHRKFGNDEPICGVLVAPSVTKRAGDMLDHEELEFAALDPKTGEPPVEEDEREAEESEKTGDADTDA